MTRIGPGIVVFALSGLAALSGFAVLGGALAQEALLSRDALLRSGPGARYRIVAALPAGAEVDVLRLGRRWTRVGRDGQTGFVASGSLRAGEDVVLMAAQPVHCVSGYPYSLSERYFSGVMTEFRHSGPLGALLGEHRRGPCW
jgi:uncharacterized protein YraI